MVSYLLDLVDEADRNNDGKIDFDEWQLMGSSCFLKYCIVLSNAQTPATRIKKRIPMAEDQLSRVCLLPSDACFAAHSRLA